MVEGRQKVLLETPMTRTPDARDAKLADTPARLHARCPLCGAVLLTVGRGGRVTTGDLRGVTLVSAGPGGMGFLLCDNCSRLTESADGLSFN